MKKGVIAVFTVALFHSAAFAANDAQFVSQDAPARVRAGAVFSAGVTMRNSGATTWSRDGDYKLGAQSPMDNTIWSDEPRVWMREGDSVAPGGEYEFRRDFRAPGQPGGYGFQWQMVQDGVEWFGEMSQNAAIEVETAPSLQCDGSEVVCLTLASQSEVETAGGGVRGGGFEAGGFRPSEGGGIDWEFGAGFDFSEGAIEVDVTGLVPNDLGELAGGKVSIFSMCGLGDYSNYDVGLQKMAQEYRDGNIFRYGMDNDGLADNWDAVIITGRDFGCYYSINDPPWQPGETHHFRATWGPDGLTLKINGTYCESRGNGDTMTVPDKLFVLANRCQHYPRQQADAVFSNLRLWALGTSCQGGCTPGETESRQCGVTDVGRCAMGSETRQCGAGCAWGAWGGCDAVLPSAAELCNGEDDDCDGTTDEDLDCRPGQTKECGNCGTSTCTAGCAWGPCEGEGECAPQSEGVCEGGVKKCSDVCSWGACEPLGSCAAGEKLACGTCGERVCGPDSKWGVCEEPPACGPGSDAGHPADGGGDGRAAAGASGGCGCASAQENRPVALLYALMAAVFVMGARRRRTLQPGKGSHGWQEVLVEGRMGPCEGRMPGLVNNKGAVPPYPQEKSLKLQAVFGIALPPALRFRKLRGGIL